MGPGGKKKKGKVEAARRLDPSTSTGPEASQRKNEHGWAEKLSQESPPELERKKGTRLTSKIPN